MIYRFLRFPGGKSKALTFSYDDGFQQDVRLAEVFNKYCCKCTFNFNSQALRGEKGIKPDEVRKYILNHGHEIALHGSNHRPEGILRPIEGIQDVLANRLELEQSFDTIIRGMAYPGSGINFFAHNANFENVKQYLKELDIVYARTINGDNDSFRLPSDWYAWMPNAHHGNPRIFEYIDKFLHIDADGPKSSGTQRIPCLFYIWGHSYEFDDEDNWERIDLICKQLAFHNDIWYATNMEIYNYVQAYHSLVYSADGSRIYNPTLQTIWFDTDGVLGSIQPGEMIVFR